MPETVRLVTPRLRVTLDDGSTWDVQTSNPDMVAWDRTRSQRRWPKFDDAPFLWMTFLAWSASRRRAQTEISWEEFERRAESIANLSEDDEETEATADAVPIQPAPVAG